MHDANPELLFWLFFMGINSLIFLPPYLIHYPNSSFLPPVFYGKTTTINKQKSNLFVRVNQDIFRISADLAIMVLPILFIRYPLFLNIYGMASALYFVLILVHQITNAICRKIYHKELTNFEVLQYLQLGYTIVRHSAIHQLLLLAAGLLLLLSGTGYGFHALYRWMGKQEFSGITAGILLLFGLIPYYVRKRVMTLAFSNKVFPLHAYELFKLIFLSSAKGYRLTRNIDTAALAAEGPKPLPPLNKRPNIYVIAVESYGRMLLDQIDAPGNTYRSDIKEAGALLEHSGFFSCSALSTSPISGAGSWIAYSSFLYGINMRNQMIYDHMLSDRQMHGFNHLFRMLQKSGYTNYRLNAVGVTYDGVAIPWERYSSFYSVDEWIHFNDMGYTGQMYGLGPAPPDQYILHNTARLVKAKQKEPFSLFILTQNSHNPFHTCPPYHERWEDCCIPPEQVEKKGAKLVSLPDINHYYQAISYELRTISNFIVQEGGDNDIFILFGDHQPPIFSEADAGTETLVHIITRQKDLLKEWEEQGFVRGMETELSRPFFRHEGLYSLFLRAMTRMYAPGSELPPYQPDGLSLFKKTDAQP
jgi:hypothetical protein